MARLGMVGIGLLTAVSVLLVGCAAGVPEPGGTFSGLDIPRADGFPDADATADPAAFDAPPDWASGVLPVFDDVVALDPTAKGLRAEVAEADAAGGAALLGTVTDLAQDGDTDADPAAWAGGGSGDRGAVIEPALAAADEVRSDDYVTAGVLISWAMQQIYASPQVQLLADGQSEGSEEGGIKATRNGDDIELDISDSTKLDDGKTTVSHRMQVEGTICPAADGRFDFTVTGHIEVGTAVASAVQDLKARIHGTLGEDAAPEDIAVESSEYSKRSDEERTTEISTIRSSRSSFIQNDAPTKVLSRSDGISESEAKEQAAESQARADEFAAGIVLGMFSVWRFGGCVRLETEGPSTLGLLQTGDVDVKVRTKLSQEEADGEAKLRVTEGGGSLSAEKIDVSGTVSYTAGDEMTTATVEVDATTRRGGVRGSLEIKVGFEGWRADGTFGPYQVVGSLCPAWWAQRSADYWYFEGFAFPSGELPVNPDGSHRQLYAFVKMGAGWAGISADDNRDGIGGDTSTYGGDSVRGNSGSFALDADGGPASYAGSSPVAIGGLDGRKDVWNVSLTFSPANAEMGCGDGGEYSAQFPETWPLLEADAAAG